MQSLLAPPHEGESPDGLTMTWCAALVVVGACDVSKSLRPPHLPTPVCVCECVSVGYTTHSSFLQKKKTIKFVSPIEVSRYTLESLDQAPKKLQKQGKH